MCGCLDVLSKDLAHSGEELVWVSCSALTSALGPEAGSGRRLTLHPADSTLVGKSRATSSCEVGLIWKISFPLGLAKPVVGVESCGC